MPVPQSNLLFPRLQFQKIGKQAVLESSAGFG
jgi:hypothetical protein